MPEILSHTPSKVAMSATKTHLNRPMSSPYVVYRPTTSGCYNRPRKGFSMNIETLMTILVVATVATLLVRIFTGFTLAGILASFLLGCLGAIGGWVAQQRLGLPPLYAFPFPGDHVAVSAVWPG